MKIVENVDLLRIKGKYQAKYGIAIDDWSATIYCEIEEQFKGLKSENQKAVQEINEAQNLIKGKITSVHFNNPKEAFYYGLGKTAAIALLIFFISIIYFLFSNLKENENNNFSTLIKQSEVINLQGEMFLVLKPNEKNKPLSVGKEYIFESKKNRVLVPLGPIRPK